MTLSKLNFFKIKQFVWDKGANYLFVLFISLSAVVYAYLLENLPTQNGDDIEHIHSSFLVAMGDVPYRDFFQHHNPMLWYLFSPIVWFFRYNSIVVEVVEFISFLVFLKSMVYVYRIVMLVFNRHNIAISVVSAIMLPWYKLYPLDFRPDNYMIFCLMGGLYYYFLYLREKSSGSLVFSFLFFMVSFLFAQKGVFPLSVIGLTVLYFLFKKEILWADFLKASVLPIILGVMFLYYLYHYDMIELYWRSNYIFNLKLVEGFEASKIGHMPFYINICCWVGGFGAVISLFYANKYAKILGILFLSELWQRGYYFSPYSYYYWMLLYFACMNASVVFDFCYKKSRMFEYAVVALLFWGLLNSWLYHLPLLKNRDIEKLYLPNYVTREINPCDYVFNGDGMMFNLFGKDPAYYWQLIGQLDVMGEEVGIRPKPDVNQLIIDLKPKVIYGDNYYNKFSSEQRKFEVVHYVDKKIVEKYYDKTPYMNIYKLKSEYDNRKCIRKGRERKWRYVD